MNGKLSFRHVLTVVSIAAVLAAQVGCSTMKSPGLLSEDQAEKLQEKLGTIGVVSSKYAPRVEMQQPARGGVAGAAKGAVQLPLSFIETAVRSGNPYMTVLSIIVSPIMAVAGGVSGAVTAEPVNIIEQQEAALSKPLNEMNVQETMRTCFMNKTQEMNQYVFTDLAEEGPRVDGEHPDYRGLNARGIKTVHEIAMREFGLEGDRNLEPQFRLYMQAQARLVSTENNNPILVRTFTCESKYYDFSFWTAGNAQRFQEEINRCYDDLTDMMMATIYLKDTVLRGARGREQPSTRRAR